MVTESILEKFGLTKDENNSKLKEVFKNNVRLKEIHIETYPENPLIASSTPFMLFLRLIETGVTVTNNSDRLILRKNDRFNTYLMNILFSEVAECYYETIDDYSHEFILNIQNVYYRMLIHN